MARRRRSVSELLRKTRQIQAITGRALSPSEIRGIAEPALATEATQAIEEERLAIGRRLREKELGLEERRFLSSKELAERRLKAEGKATTFAGIGQLATGAYALKKPIRKGLKAITGLLPGAEAAAPSFVAAGGAQATIAEGGAGIFGLSAIPEATPTATAVGAEAGLVSTVAPYVAPAIAGVGAGYLGKAITGYGREGHMGGERYTSAGIGVAGGAASGAAIGSIVPGIGTAIGAIIGGIVGLIFGGK